MNPSKKDKKILLIVLVLVVISLIGLVLFLRSNSTHQDPSPSRSPASQDESINSSSQKNQKEPLQTSLAKPLLGKNPTPHAPPPTRPTPSLEGSNYSIGTQTWFERGRILSEIKRSSPQHLTHIRIIEPYGHFGVDLRLEEKYSGNKRIEQIAMAASYIIVHLAPGISLSSLNDKYRSLGISFKKREDYSPLVYVEFDGRNPDKYDEVQSLLKRNPRVFTTIQPDYYLEIGT